LWTCDDLRTAGVGFGAGFLNSAFLVAILTSLTNCFCIYFHANVHYFETIFDFEVRTLHDISGTKMSIFNS